MKTILLPLDGSLLAEQAIPYAVLIAQTLKLPITLLRIVPDLERENLLVNSLSVISAGYSGESASVSYAYNQQVVQTLREQAQTYLDDQAETLRIQGIRSNTSVQVGMPAELVIEQANHIEAAMIIMATHGYSGIQRWTLGSVADKVVQHAKQPILLIRGTTGTHTVPRLKELLVPLDGSELARQALPVATQLAGATEARITLIHAIDPLVEAGTGIRPFGLNMTHPDWVLDDAIQQVHRELETVAKEVATNTLKVNTIAMVGYPAELIVDEAARIPADLIVMATHGYSGIRRWALGSIADKVLHTTKTPLLLVRATT
jgi:nucleotide-binding universal stress UspA family protein